MSSIQLQLSANSHYKYWLNDSIIIELPHALWKPNAISQWEISWHLDCLPFCLCICCREGHLKYNQVTRWLHVQWKGPEVRRNYHPPMTSLNPAFNSLNYSVQIWLNKIVFLSKPLLTLQPIVWRLLHEWSQLSMTIVIKWHAAFNI